MLTARPWHSARGYAWDISTMARGCTWDISALARGCRHGSSPAAGGCAPACWRRSCSWCHSFVARLGQDHESSAVVRTIIGLARTLGREVTAEGIERADQAGHLLGLGCRQGQGYLWAKPAPADQR